MFVRLASALAILSAVIAVFVLPMRVSPTHASVCSAPVVSSTGGDSHAPDSVVAIQGCGFLNYIGQRLLIYAIDDNEIVGSGVVPIDPSGSFTYNLQLPAHFVFLITVGVMDTGGLQLAERLIFEALCGDADADSVLNSIDAEFVLQYTAGLITVQQYPFLGPEIADVNQDNMVDSTDALVVLQFTAGLTPSLSCHGSDF